MNMKIAKRLYRSEMLRILSLWLLAAMPVTGVAANSATVGKTSVEIIVDNAKLMLNPLSDNSVRVQYVDSPIVELEELVYTEDVNVPKFKVSENSDAVTLKLARLTVKFDKATRALTFVDADDREILSEAVGGRTMAPVTVGDQRAYAVEQSFISPEDEYIYGTGQFQDGYLNIRGLSRRLTQVNTQISVPFILSSRGYGLLWNNYGLTEFNPADNRVELVAAAADGATVTVDATGTLGNRRETRMYKSFNAQIDVPERGRYAVLLDVGQTMARKHYLAIDGKAVVDVNNMWLPPTTSIIVELERGRHAIEVQGVRDDKPVIYWQKVADRTVFRSPVAAALDYTVFAGSADEVIASYRSLTGDVPMMPQWAFGYIHCRERYNTQDELLENAREFRTRRLPVDVIVQDWQWWGKYGWNAMQFDEDRYPAPDKMVDQLHGMNMKLMLSVWSKIDRQSVLGKQMNERGFYIDGTDWIDFFNPEAADYYWKNFSDKLLRPYRIDAWWQDATEPENDDLTGRKVNNGTVAGEFYRNVYPIMVNRTVYNGLRQDDSGRRAMILTRCGFSGIQRYGAVTWSGDVGNDWETLRRQIAGGLSQMATGLPWWTYDAGGFFRPSNQYDDEAYKERMLRWIEASTFLPLMRVHGYMSNTEPWRYGEQVERVVSECLNLRYRLLPYIYSQAAKVSSDGSTLMRPFVFDFPDDPTALEQKGEYMFGPALLVNPVTEEGVKEWKTYLPEYAPGWVDFWTGARHQGGANVSSGVSIDRIPIFVKAGSIIPFGPEKQYAAQQSDVPVEIRIYDGADASFTLYEDEGDNYNCERGDSSNIPLVWDDSRRTLTVGKRTGSFDGMQSVCTFNVVAFGETKTVAYSGKTIQVKF